MKKRLPALTGFVIASLLIAFALLNQPKEDKLLAGSTLPAGAPAVFETYLASQQGTSDSTFSLASVALRDGNTLTGYHCFTIDSGQTTLEYECGTLSGTTVNVSLRGIDALTGTTTVASIKYLHRRGADVKITDYPDLTYLINMARGADTYPAPLSYYTHPCDVSSGTTTICDKYYIDNQVTAGAAAGNTATAGIFIGSTARQAASSTATGVYNSVTYNKLLMSSYATDTPQSCSTAANGGCVIMSLLNGKLSQSWLDLTQAFTFSGGILNTASSTNTATTSIPASDVNGRALILNNIAYRFPISQSATSTFLATNGSGGLSWVSPQSATLSVAAAIVSTTQTSTTSLKTVAIPANTLASNRVIRVNSQWSETSTNGQCNMTIRVGTGSATSTVGFGIFNGGASSGGSLDGIIYSTTTNSLAGGFRSADFASGNPAMSSNSFGYIGYGNFSTAGTLYIDFAAASTNTFTPTCQLAASSVEILSN